MKFIKIFVFIILIVSFNIAVFCEENIDIENISYLTVDEAFEIAVKYNRDILNSNEEFPFLKNDYEEANKDLALNPDTYYSIKVQIAELKNTLDNYDENIQQIKDILKYDITKLFVDLIKSKKEIELEEKNILLDKQELDVSQLKFQKGLLSEAEFQSENTEYLKKYNKLKNKKLDFDSLFIDINKILGIDLEKQYSVVVDLKYEEIGNVDIEKKLQESYENNFNLKKQNQELDVLRYEYSTYTIYTDYSTKISKENDISAKERDIIEFKRNMEESLNKLYKDILNKEAINAKYEEDLIYKEKELDVLMLKYSMGRITQLEVDKKKFEIEQLKHSIQENQYEHQLLVMQFGNSNLINYSETIKQ